jgi:resuscitation-promoting factor RpfA
MDKSPDAFRTISEVAEVLATPAHVLRFWESRFPQIRPVKRAGGRRYYRPSDVALLSGIRRLLHDEGLTIRGVQKILREQGVRHVAGLNDATVAREADAYEDMTAARKPDGDGAATVLDFITQVRSAARGVTISESEEPIAGADEDWGDNGDRLPPQAAFDIFAEDSPGGDEADADTVSPAESPPEVWLPTLFRRLSPGALDNRQAALLPLSVRLAALRDQMAATGHAGRR